MEYVYDNSNANPRNPQRPPQRVTFGQTTASEMGDLWMQVRTATGDERAALDRDFAPKMLRDDTAGDEMLVQASPRDPRIRRDLAGYYAASGRTAEAIAQLERSLELDPASAEGHFQLGTLLLNEKRVNEALQPLQRATELRPDWSDAFNNLGAVLMLRGDRDAARQAFDKAIALNPRSAQALFNRGRLLMVERRPKDALLVFLDSLRVKPDDPDTRAAAAAAQAEIGDVSGAILNYREALRLRPDMVSALTELAWILAARPTADASQPDEAVRLAERAAALSTPESPLVLDTLAASYFAAGRIDEAIRTAERAVSLAAARGDATAVREIGERLAVYRARRP
jgi:Flp pilus assembly protein TadD